MRATPLQSITVVPRVVRCDITPRHNRRSVVPLFLLCCVFGSGCLAQSQARIGPVTKTLIAISVAACAATALAANTQISESHTKSHNQAWGYGGLFAGLGADVLALVALIVPKDPGGNWWTDSGWAWVTGLGTATAAISGIAAIVRVGSMYAQVEGKECVKGCPCGNTCIDCSKVCHL